jgi:hypothetical protein
MRPAAALLVLLALTLPAIAGCTSPATDKGNGGTRPPPPPKVFQADAPWWDVGDSYAVRLMRAGSPDSTWRMVNYFNDTDTAHFWLGVSDRRQAMDMALFDTNPFMGRIHHAILTPHEHGMHASMYQFPLVDGKTWQGFFFNHNWTFTVREGNVPIPGGSDRGFLITAQSTDGDGHTLSFDYSPKMKWFSTLEQLDGRGQRVVRAVVENYEQRVSGTYTFLRGVDFHKGPLLPGTHDERFTVREKVDALAFFVDAKAAGPLEVQLLDPNGNVRQRATSPAGGQADAFAEVRPVPQGEWMLRYISTGNIEGRVWATGLIETTRTV